MRVRCLNLQHQSGGPKQVQIVLNQEKINGKTLPTIFLSSFQHKHVQCVLGMQQNRILNRLHTQNQVEFVCAQITIISFRFFMLFFTSVLNSTIKLSLLCATLSHIVYKSHKLSEPTSIERQQQALKKYTERIEWETTKKTKQTEDKQR